MDRPDRALDDALATLRSRWGTAAIRIGGGLAADAEAPIVHGSLALAPMRSEEHTSELQSH